MKSIFDELFDDPEDFEIEESESESEDRILDAEDSYIDEWEFPKLFERPKTFRELDL